MDQIKPESDCKSRPKSKWPFIKNGINISESESISTVFGAVFLIVLTFFLHLSYLHEGLFMDRLIAGSSIVALSLVMARIGKKKGPEVISKTKLYVVYQKKKENEEFTAEQNQSGQRQVSKVS